MRIPNKAGSPLYRVENGRKLHNVFEVVMDGEIDPVHLKNAVDDAVRLFPAVSYSIVCEDGMVYFTENDNEIVVPESGTGIVQGSRTLNGHMFCVSYEGNRIRSNLSHMITDGGGMNRFADALIKSYCRYHYDLDIPMPEKLPDEVLMRDFWDLDYSDVESIEEEVFAKEGYVLPEAVYGKQTGRNTDMCVVRAPEESFMEFVKANGTSASVMMFLILSEAVYRLHPEAKGTPVAGRLTVNARKQLGIPDTFVNCSLGSQISVTSDELAEEGYGVIGPRLRASIKRQTSPEYLRYIAKQIAVTKTFPPDLKPSFTISYMGSADPDIPGGHIKDVLLYEGEVRKLNAYTFDHEFRFVFHFSEGSGRYAECFAGILNESGVGAVCDEPVVLPEEEEE